jgi:putative OPT family oligopeptide transporter
MEMKEFTFRALLIGLVMTAILGSANAYLGLKAGMTIAATYPAAVIGMALLRLMKGSLLEENIARTVGSIGESVAAGAVFTIPAFVMAGLWPGLTREKYWNSVALMVIGGTLGILFVTLLRRVMVEDPDLPYPESVAASEIHKAGQQGAKAAKILFANMGFGGFMYLLGEQYVSGDHQCAGQEVAAAHGHESERRDYYHRRSNAADCARYQPSVSRSGLHHWSAAGGA